MIMDECITIVYNHRKEFFCPLVAIGESFELKSLPSTECLLLLSFLYTGAISLLLLFVDFNLIIFTLECLWLKTSVSSYCQALELINQIPAGSLSRVVHQWNFRGRPTYVIVVLTKEEKKKREKMIGFWHY